MVHTVVISEPNSGLQVRAALLSEKAPAITRMITDWLTEPRSTPAIHAMWTGPEISAKINVGELDPLVRTATPPLQNATINPLLGDLVFTRIPEHCWGGAPQPIFDLGLFYGDHARLLFPIGLVPGSVFGRVVPEDLEALAAACAIIRSRGKTELHWALS